MTDPRTTIHEFIVSHQKKYQEISMEIHEHPEVSDFEFLASKLLSEQLKEEGFEIELPAAGHRTGFAARKRYSEEGPVIVFLAEYDALAGLGHGCGHNLFGATSALAGAALLQVIRETGGEVRVYGTPGEEGGQNGSAKGSFVREGYLKDVDAALCIHPGTSPENMLSYRTLGCAPVDIEFHGLAAHAAACPENGKNALDAQILVYNGLSVLRQQLTPDVRIHGIITDGGTAPNVIPDYTKSKYYLRAASMDTLHDLNEKAEKIVQGAALMTGTEGSMKLYQNLVENMVLTPGLDQLYEKNLNLLGHHSKPQFFEVMPGSSDVGNISQVVPTIQPSLSITDHKIAGHSPDMVKASASEKGMAMIPLGAEVLADTALDLIQDPELLKHIKEEHRYNVEHQKEGKLFGISE